MDLSDFPRDGSGIIKGQWKLFHCNPEFAADMGVTSFVDGVTTRPVGGAPLQRIIATFGDRIERAEPWEIEVDHGALSGAEPEARAEPTPVAPDTVRPPVEDDPYADLERDELFALCMAKELAPDRRWGAPRLRAYLRENA